MSTRISTPARNALAQQVQVLVDAGPAAGTLKIYTGAQPATADTAASGTLLVTVTLGDPAFGAAAAGTITGADPAAVNAVATGTAGWFRVADSTGATVYDGSATATGGGGDLQLVTTSITSGQPVDITSLTVTMPAG
ncbi:MAG: hypothetical protein KBF43_09085 [Dermatophilaceae bacterium]|nr:hypothetical protein [Dermatophilaceae bacterium]